ncbi:bifunctional glutamate--cysteine ligase GshA/glutathione synthetase GshB [Enterococcus camelliae]|uniref:Glutathione biosynthesis bifunctional protein GshAB n=1 Tax=Enterococcus camelliae TaxID=453959 RepID=A0ABW5TIQ4_9ENTE
MDYRALLLEGSVQPFLLKARYGIERESQRVTEEGQLVTTNHPKSLGNRKYHPYIQTDFAETQVELITPVCQSIPELFRYLAAIHDVCYRSLDGQEMLWPLSMPPHLPLKEEEIRLAKLDRFEDVLYRRYLAKTYGRRKQMMSGIHFNFEFGDDLLRRLFAQQTEETDYQQFKTKVYLKVTRNYLSHRWFITYLFGASPLSEPNFFVGAAGPKEPVRSLRNSSFGYKNHDDVQVRYDTLPHYLEDLQQMVEDGKLSEEKEFYSAVRLRGGKKVSDLGQVGIQYIELRNLDLNPFATYGISEDQVSFLHLYLLFMLVKEESTDEKAIKKGSLKNNVVSLENPLQESVYQEEARQLFAELKTFLQTTRVEVAKEFLEQIERAIEEPSQTLAGRWYQKAKEQTQAKQAVAIGKTYEQKAWEKPYQLAGFRSMELSTQILLFDAIQKGLAVNVLDEEDQFVQLSADQHIEYVKNANMTSKDTYIAPLLMANKTVTKKVLAQAGFVVPAGGEYVTEEQAFAAYHEFSDHGFVVKPKTTNYGVGISIFKETPDFADFQAAVRLAFAEDDAILIEEFLPGTEYRFFVIDDQVKAIMLRVPANVIGDGQHSIRELVAKKNTDPLRGTNHRAPLEYIQLGEIEELMLKAQGYLPTSIPAEGVTVYLRENSNVSTGGDSIDVTEDLHDDYKQVAVAAVKAIGAVISGIDFIIPDKSQPASNPGAYGIIEANFNPAMHMHVFPYSGTGRRLTMDVLRLLFPERIEPDRN